MTANMMKKVETLRSMISDGITYNTLKELTFRNEELPSMSSLRKYDLLKVVREEKIEETMTAEEWENACMEYDYYSSEWAWDEERELYVFSEVVRYYGIK